MPSAEGAHKYKIGRRVAFNLTVSGARLETGSFEVTQLLPPANGDFQYRVKSLDGRVQRIVLESQLL